MRAVFVSNAYAIIALISKNRNGVKPNMADPNESTQIPVSADPPAAPAADQPKDTIKSITCDGYTFQVDTDVIDDVDNVDLVDKIENDHNLKAIVEFLQKLLGNEGYDNLKAYFVKKDGRLKLSKLGELYQAIFDQFDPKD